MIAATQHNEENAYMSEIEQMFLAKSGKRTMLNSLDWQLMQQWEARNIPLPIVARGLDAAFKSSKNGVGTLRYCEKAVDAAFRDWQTAQTGAHAQPQHVVASSAPTAPASDDGGGDSAKIEQILRQLLTAMSEFYNALQQSDVPRPYLLETVADVGRDLRKTHKARAQYSDANSAERALAPLADKLDETLAASLTADEQHEIDASIRAELAQFKERWTREQYEKTYNAIFDTDVRKHFGAPELTIFK